VLVEKGRFEIEDVEFTFGDEEVLVKGGGSGLCTSELPAWSGDKPDYPRAMGHEGWGVVVDKGRNVSDRIATGDRVSGLPMKCYADYFVQAEWCTMRLEPSVQEQCILGEPYYCVNNVVRAAHPDIGDALAIVGLGPMGQWALQALQSPVLQSVIAVDVDDAKLEIAKAYGATHAVNPKNEDAVDTIRKITNGRMADVVVEGTGAKAGVELAAQALRPGKRPRLVIMSFFKEPIEVNLTKLCAVAAEIICAHPGLPTDRPDHVRRTEIMINHGVFKSDHLITHRFKLEDINRAFEALASRGEGYIKGIVVP
jgi:threonine dehydrogenase-like Zn-dependent dehydrogenase